MKEAHRANTRYLLLSALVLSSSAFQAQAYYHPDEGRWISRDPMWEGGGMNLYSFCRNATTIWIDPLGEDVKNSSSCPVVVKPGSDKDPPVVVPPGGEYKGTQDGVYTCCGDKCQVYKTVNNINVTVTSDNSFDWSGGSLKEKIGQVCIGGCKDDNFLKKWPNWPSKAKVKQLCDEAKKKQEEEKKKQNPPPPPEKK